MVRRVLQLGVGVVVIAHATVAFAVTQIERSPMPLPLRVEKSKLVNSRHELVRLRGVNAASLEWVSDGEGHIFDTVKTAIKDWRVNVIRLPLAQDRWFGKAPEQKDEGKAYRELVEKIVDYCAEERCYIILDLHWSDAGEWGKQIGQHVMPDQNSLEFWKSCASTYKNHPAVIFDLYNEPHDVSWDIWLNGGQVAEKAFGRNPAKSFQAVGMQATLDAVRATGAKNLIVVGGLDWAYDMKGFLAGKQIADPMGNGVIFANHAYPFKGDTVERWISKMEEASKLIPIIVGEFGADSRGSARTKGQTDEEWVRRVLQALEGHKWSWIAWDLHPAAGPRLISDWKYTPTPYFGAWVKRTLDGTLSSNAPPASAAALGIFENHGDVGTVSQPGSIAFDDSTHSYTVSGSGENMWSTRDAFHYVWKKASGDLEIAADIAFKGAGKEAHRKACLIIRQSLDPDSAYVDAALHGDGLTSLQFREAKGTATHEVQANVTAPRRLRIEKMGKYVRMYLGTEGKEPSFSGAAVRMTLEDPFYVGLGVCAHTNDAIETAVFSRVELGAPKTVSTSSPTLYSALETQTIASTDRRVVHVTPTRIEAPNWLRDGASLIYNSDGRICACRQREAYRRPLTPALPFVVTTITAFHRMATCSRSATSRRGAGNP